MSTPTPRWHTREDSGLKIDRELRWWHDDERIEHPNIIETFNKGLRVDANGRVRLEIGTDWCFVTIEDAAFGVTAVDVSEGDRLSLRLTDRTAEWLDSSTLSLDDEGVLHAVVKGAKARARFTREAQTQIGQFFTAAGDLLELHVGSKHWPTPLKLEG